MQTRAAVAAMFPGFCSARARPMRDARHARCGRCHRRGRVRWRGVEAVRFAHDVVGHRLRCRLRLRFLSGLLFTPLVLVHRTVRRTSSNQHRTLIWRHARTFLLLRQPNIQSLTKVSNRQTRNRRNRVENAFPENAAIFVAVVLTFEVPNDFPHHSPQLRGWNRLDASFATAVVSGYVGRDVAQRAIPKPSHARHLFRLTVELSIFGALRTAAPRSGQRRW